MRARATLVSLAAFVALGGCASVLGIDSDRHVGGDAALDPWSCTGDAPPTVATRPVQVKLLVNDVSTASVSNSFAGNPIPDATVRACSTLDVACDSPVGNATSDASGFAFITVPAGFSGYYELTASGFTPAIAWHTPQYVDEYLQQGMMNDSLLAAGGGLAGITTDPNKSFAVVSVLDCNEQPAPEMLIEIGAPGTDERVVYLVNSLPSASATETDATGSAIVYNVPAGTFQASASFASDHRPLRAITTLARQGWVTFVQIRLDQTHRSPI